MNDKKPVYLFVIAYLITGSMLIVSFELWATVVYVTIYSTSVMLYTLFSLYLFKSKAIDRANSALENSEILFALLFIAGLLFRLLMWGLPPELLSDDVYRYLWEGKVAASGINPYLYAPDDEALKHLREGLIYPNVAHAMMKAVYPPVGQLLFEINHHLSSFAGIGSLTGWRVMMLLFDLSVFYMLLVQTNRSGALLYWLHFAVMAEFALAVHLDIVAVFFLMVALWAFLKEQYVPWAFFFALAVITKLVPLFFLPAFVFFYVTVKKIKLKTVFATSITAGLTLLFFWLLYDLHQTDFSSLHVYLRHWRFNESIHFFMVKFAGDEATWLRPVFTAAFVVAVSWHWRRDLLKSLQWSYLVFLFFSAVIHPWYVLYLLPLAVIRPLTVSFVFVAAVTMSYEVLVDFHLAGKWHSNRHIQIIEYFLVYTAALFSLVSEFKRESRRNAISKEINRCHHTCIERRKKYTGFIAKNTRVCRQSDCCRQQFR